MASPIHSLWKCYEKWLRLMTLIDHAGEKICRDLLFIKERVPEDGKKLYNFLRPFKYSIELNRDQRSILYPHNHCTDKSKFDISLYIRIIQGVFVNKYQSLDYLRTLRNKLFHTGCTNLTEAHFNKLWNDASNLLKWYNFDMSSVARLKDCEFSLPQEYGKSLLNCIEALLKGNVELFACLSYIFCISGYLICSNLNGFSFIVKVKSTVLVNYTFLIYDQRDKFVSNFFISSDEAFL